MYTAYHTEQAETLGAFIPNPGDPLLLPMLQGFEDTSYANGMAVMTVNLENHAKDQAGTIRGMYHMGGAFVFGAKHTHSSLCREFSMMNIPYVCCNANGKIKDNNNIQFDMMQGINAIIDRFCQTGRSKIAFLGCKDVVLSVMLSDMYNQAMADRNLPYKHAFFCKDYNCADLTTDLFDGPDFPDAFIAANVALAGNLIHVLSHEDIDVPRKAAVAGWGGSELALLMHPSLTTVEPDLYQLGVLAAQSIMARMGIQSAHEESGVIDFDLVVRESA